MIKPYSNRITTSATTTVVASTVYVRQIVISCANAGTSWTLRVQDKSSTPLILIPDFTLSVPVDGYTNVMWGGVNYHPIPMIGGIDIVTTGTPGVVNVWIIAETSP